MTESEVIFIKKSDLLYLMQHDLTFLNNFLMMSNNAHINNQKRIKVLIQKSIRDKILFHLYEEAKVRKVNIIPIASKAQLAAFLNIPRPSLSRELIKMKQEQLIDYDRYSITLNNLH